MELTKKESYMFWSAIAAFYCVLIGMISFWTDRNLDFWFSYFKGHPIDVPYWMSFLVSVVFNVIIVGFNIIAELAKAFI